MTRGPSLIGTKPIYSQTLSRVQLFDTPLARILQWVAIFLLLLQGIFPTQGSNPCLLDWQEDSLPLSHLGSN